MSLFDVDGEMNIFLIYILARVNMKSVTPPPPYL